MIRKKYIRVLYISLNYSEIAGMGRFIRYFLVAALTIGLPTAARALDCTKIKTTNVPYQITIQKDDTKNYLVQIYRGENLTRRQVSIVNDKLFIAYYQANFQLQNPGVHGTNIKITYSVPTDRYIWTQGTRVVHGNSIIDGKLSSGPSFEATYAMLADEVIVLGRCSFPVKHYTVRQESSAVKMRLEVWFSPELNTFLRTTILTTIASTGKTTQIKLEARSLDTVFTPFR